MVATVGNWVGETTVTTGTGPIILSGAIQGYVTFSDIGDGEYWYAIVDGFNREAGVGTLANGIFTRDTVYSILFSGIYSDNNPSPISLSGSAEVYSTFNKTAMDEFTDHVFNQPGIHFADADADGEQYARQDNAWTVVAATGGGDQNIDGGRADSIYTAPQVIDGGTASG